MDRIKEIVETLKNYKFETLPVNEAKYVELLPYYLDGYSEKECREMASKATGEKYDHKTFRKYIKKYNIDTNTAGYYNKKMNEKRVICTDLKTGNVSTFKDRYECIDFLKTVFPSHTTEQLRKGIKKSSSWYTSQYLGYRFREEEKIDTRIAPDVAIPKVREILRG